MKRVVAVIAAGACLLAGCTSQPQSDPVHSQNLSVSSSGTPATPAKETPALTVVAPAPTASPQTDARIIARVNGEPITLHDLLEPLMASRGLALLLNLAQLDLAKQDLRAQHLGLTAEDIEHEQNLTLEKLFHDRDQKEQDRLTDAELKKDAEAANQIRTQMHQDREKFLVEYLEKKGVSRAEYDIVIQINACLRKAAEVATRGKVTDELIETEFGRQYGETAKCRVIQFANAREVSVAQRRLAAGEDFALVAREMSRNAQTRELGGELPPFSQQTQAIPNEFRQLAFSLQPGQVSDMLVLGENYFLLKLEQKFAPKAVKFADVKEILRKDIADAMTEKVMVALHENLGQQVYQQITIGDPMLSKQFEDLKAKQEGEIKEGEKINEQMKKEREAANAAAATQQAEPIAPTTGPATMPAPLPPPAPLPASAPATRPGAL